MLPKMSGVDVCRAIRSRSQVPIIMVTAKGTEIDTVVGLEVGADDYVTKPYRLRELVARMRAVLRRAPAWTPPPARDGDDAGDTSGGPRGRRCARRPRPPPGLRARARKSTCAARSSSLLALLIENAGRVLTRDTLIDRVWGTDYVGDTKTLDVHIKRLRSHVEADPSVARHHHHGAGRRLSLRDPRRGVSIDPFAPARLGPLALRNRFIKAATFEGATPRAR